jgi:hypothetical protein
MPKDPWLRGARASKRPSSKKPLLKPSFMHDILTEDIKDRGEMGWSCVVVEIKRWNCPQVIGLRPVVKKTSKKQKETPGESFNRSFTGRGLRNKRESLGVRCIGRGVRRRALKRAEIDVQQPWRSLCQHAIIKW